MLVAAVLLGVLLPLAYGTYYFLSSFGPSASGIRSLQAEGKSIVDAVERHKATHGRYPATLTEAGVSTPHTWYGSWRYDASPGGDTFDLEIGDYRRYGFVMWWNGDGWGIDA